MATGVRVCLPILQTVAAFPRSPHPRPGFSVRGCAMLSRDSVKDNTASAPRESMSPRAADMLSRGEDGVTISGPSRKSMAHP